MRPVGSCGASLWFPRNLVFLTSSSSLPIHDARRPTDVVRIVSLVFQTLAHVVFFSTSSPQTTAVWATVNPLPVSKPCLKFPTSCYSRHVFQQNFQAGEMIERICNTHAEKQRDSASWKICVVAAVTHTQMTFRRSNCSTFLSSRFWIYPTARLIASRNII